MLRDMPPESAESLQGTRGSIETMRRRSRECGQSSPLTPISPPAKSVTFHRSNAVGLENTCLYSSQTLRTRIDIVLVVVYTGQCSLFVASRYVQSHRLFALLTYTRECPPYDTLYPFRTPITAQLDIRNESRHAPIARGARGRYVTLISTYNFLTFKCITS
jgi:hypothetical protein